MKLYSSDIGKAADADTLRELHNRILASGYDSEFLRTRLEYQECHQTLSQYLYHFAACEKCKLYRNEHGTEHEFLQPLHVYPRFLPTQADGRWSVTHPPMITINKELRDELIVPDPGTVWVCWDWDALYAKMAAAYSGDKLDLDAFARGHDIHTIAACQMLHISLPLNLANPHTSPECTAWREQHQWKGKQDPRRDLAKVRYCLIFGMDERAVHGSQYEKDMVKMGYDRKILEDAGRKFLRSKPLLVSCKRKWWEHCARTGVSYTILGRKRVLLGDKLARSKEGWCHMLQGLEADMLNLALIELLEPNPRWHLVYPAHDAAKISIPDTDWTPATLQTFKNAVEREWTLEGNMFKATASWHLRWPDGRKENI